MMNDLQKELDQAYKLVSAVSVRGDDVDLMSAAREHLRRAWKLAEPSEGEDADG